MAVGDGMVRAREGAEELPESKKTRTLSGLAVCVAESVFDYLCAVVSVEAEVADDEFSYTSTGAIQAPLPTETVMDERTGEVLPAEMVQA
eukprot:1402449-Amphidinium_carterae.1